MVRYNGFEEQNAGDVERHMEGSQKNEPGICSKREERTSKVKKIATHSMLVVDNVL